MFAVLWTYFLETWANVLGHGQLRYVFAAVTAFVFSLITGAYLIKKFHSRQVFEDTSQPDHDELNKIQSRKKNVPTMGGLMILCGIFAALLLWADLRSQYTVNGILCMVSLGALGLVDDYLKLSSVESRGLKKKTKLIFQIVVGLLVGYILFVNISEHPGATQFLVPFTEKWSFEMGAGYLLWAVLVIVATSNAVNLADGLDGLAGGCTAIAAAALMGLGFLIVRFGGGLEAFAGKTPGAEEMCVIAAATFGGVLGFLWYNAHPAQVFMGDTGSLALGGLLGYVALGLKLEIPLLLAGAVFFIDELTVALQIVGFKLTRKRIFPIAPIHHYFQTGLRWPEQKITTRLWIVAALGALISFALLKLRGT